MAKVAAKKKPATEPPVQEPRAVAELRKVEGAIKEIGSVGAGIAALREKYAGVTFNVTTPAGMAEARAARQEIREPRYRVEQIRKAAKAPILEMGRALDGEATRITNEILAIEGPVDTAIKTEEARVEAERQAKVEAERKRVETILARIQRIRDAQEGLYRLTADQLERRIAELEALEVNAEFAEFEQNAEDARLASLSLLRATRDQRKAHEAEQERIRKEGEELARRKAEQDRLDAEAKARRDAEAAEVARRQKEQDERDAELKRREDALKAPPPPASFTAAAVVPLPAESPAAHPGEDAIITVLSDHYEAPRRTVIAWLRDSDFTKEFT